MTTTRPSCRRTGTGSTPPPAGGLTRSGRRRWPAGCPGPRPPRPGRCWRRDCWTGSGRCWTPPPRWDSSPPRSPPPAKRRHLMAGSVYQRCSCRDPQTRRPLGASCPRLRSKGHALGWFYRYSAPPVPGDNRRRRPEAGPFPTKREAEEELSATLARIGGGAAVTDRGLLTRDFLANWLTGMRLKLKPLTYASYEEAVRLYFSPGVGHLRLVDLRDHHLQDLVGAMLAINRPEGAGGRPAEPEMLRRLLAARADDARRVLPEGERRRKKSAKPLSPARVERLFAVLSSAITS